jgi:hypothetical protein
MRSAPHNGLLPAIVAINPRTSALSRGRQCWSAWAGLDVDRVATTSTNDDRNVLFQQTDCVVACAGVRIHNKNGGDYLGLSSDRAVVAAKGKGSAWLRGRLVSGSPAYADRFSARVLQLRNSLP